MSMEFDNVKVWIYFCREKKVYGTIAGNDNLCILFERSNSKRERNIR
jgi:sRNA-binding regulator protein Hfq